MDNMFFHKVKSDNDWGIFLELEKKVANSSPYYIAFTNLADLKKFVGKSIIYLMFYKHKPVGHIEYEMKDKETAEITGFVLLPRYREKGLGKILFKKVMDELKNVKRIFLMTHPENSAALLIYLSFGFTIKAWRNNYYGNGQPRLRLELIKN